MKKKRYEGHMDYMDSYKIYLNVNHLKKGTYELKIVYKNRVIKNAHFTKE
ncbi:MAG: hypothetical protein ACR2MM_04755 [Flavobacteriaceae bacterium]